MRKIWILMLTAGLVACGGGGGGGGGGGDGLVQLPPDPCSNTGQKQFVLDNMRNWYLWNELLPEAVDIDDYATPEALLEYLTSFQSLDSFSFINSAQADQQFFGEGRFEGFGFSWRWVDSAQTDLRITRVFTDSPANGGGLGRGQQVLTLNGRTVGSINSSEGIGAFFDANDTVTFDVRRSDNSTFTTSITQGIVTIDPIPQWRIIDAGGGINVGYMELSSFISTADPRFDTVFADFAANNVNDVIIDLRYNGGGLVNTAELLGDYLGGLVAENLTFSRTEFNADRAAANNSEEFFERRGNSISLSRLVVIATRGTASASELVANSMIPHAEVTIVGDRTFGKPVGQIGLEFCEKILRPTAFKTVNANGEGDYFDGLPLGSGCAAADDLSVPVGDDADPNVVKALGFLATGFCPISSVPATAEKGIVGDYGIPRVDRRGPPHRELLDAY